MIDRRICGGGCQGQRDSVNVEERGTKKYGRRPKPGIVEMAKETFKNGQFNIKFDVISITVMWTFSISTNWLRCVSELFFRGTPGKVTEVHACVHGVERRKSYGQGEVRGTELLN